MDIEVISKMSYEELKYFSLTLGDAISVKDFCKSKATPTKRESLIEKLKRKLGNKQTSSHANCSQFDSNASTSSGIEYGSRVKKSKTKISRTIELGWIHNGKQLRAISGGGTRKISVPKNWKKEDILTKAVSLFFPDGKSSKGKIERYDKNIFDFQKKELNENLTISEIFEITELPVLRFYLSTTEKEEVYDDNSEQQENVINIDEPPETGKNVPEDVSVESTLSFNEYPDENFQMEQYIAFNYFDEGNRNNSYILDDSFLNVETMKLSLHRGYIYKEMLDAFVNMPDTSNIITLEVQILLPNGEEEAAFDAGGVLKDSLTEFWETFYESRCIGSSTKVPCTRHDYNDLRWKAVAKILYQGFSQANFFPSKLARPFIEFAIFGTIKTEILDSFLNFVGPSDALTIKRASKDFDSVSIEEIMDIMQNLDCKLIVNKENFDAIVLDIAHKEIIQKPKFIIDTFGTVLKNKISFAAIEEIYNHKKVTNNNVLKLLKTTDGGALPSQQENVMNFLKRFIREAELPTLENFLRYCTGANIITTDKITVIFNSTTGIQRAPVAHTCTNTIELPTSYDEYLDFKSEFKNILSSGIWVMDII